MNREEILEKSRQENKNGDERERVLSTKAQAYSMVGMAVMLIVLSCIKFKKGESVYDLLALYFSSIASSEVFRYCLLKEKKYLYTAICYVLTSVLFMITFIIER